MKIRTCLIAASLTLAIVIVVGCVVLVGLGGCVAYKLQKKIDAKNKREATNNVEEFSARMLSDYKASTGDTQAFALTMIQVVTQQAGVSTIWRLETSTNLSQWQTLLQTADPAEIDGVVSESFNAPTDAVRFFRTSHSP